MSDYIERLDDIFLIGCFITLVLLITIAVISEGHKKDINAKCVIALGGSQVRRAFDEWYCMVGGEWILMEGEK